MFELIRESIMLGVVGSLGATTTIFFFQLLRGGAA